VARLGDAVQAVRSKNAGPFMVTIDIFCGSDAAFRWVDAVLSPAAVGRLYRVRPQDMRRFALPGLRVVKFSFPRPVPQGSRRDRDMHGAQWAVLLAEAEFGDEQVSGDRHAADVKRPRRS